MDLTKVSTALEVLAAIDAWAARNSESGETRRYLENRRLWDVLTALRGPDSGDVAVKSATTAPIRHKALPHLSSRCGLSFPLPEAVLPMSNEKIVCDAGFHFQVHTEMACKALGIATW